MFKRRTLFIVGAGASCEFDFPTSPKLANLIAEKANVKINDYSSKPAVGDPDIIAAIRRAGQRSNMVLEAAHRIRDGVRFTSSIDDFLDIHGTDGDVNAVGKLAIAKVVLEAERRSKLYFN